MTGRLPLPPLDLHAHVDPAITASDLQDLEAVVVAVTRTLDEFDLVAQRSDELTIWAVGCHPGRADAISTFDAARFEKQLGRAAFVGEVGLDARSPVPLDDQTRVFGRVLASVAAAPRPVTVHSAGLHERVIDLVEEHRSPGIILHWWTGGRRATDRAVAAGCWFSVNGSPAQRRIAEQLPPDRVLTETDYPYTRRRDAAATRPGASHGAEAMLAAVWQSDEWGVRSTLWRTFASLVVACRMGQLLPDEVRRLVIAA